MLDIAMVIFARKMGVQVGERSVDGWERDDGEGVGVT